MSDLLLPARKKKQGIAYANVMAICRSCRKRHEYHLGVTDLAVGLMEWSCKHPKELGHDTDFIIKRREIPGDLDDSFFEANNVVPWFLRFSPNADIKPAFAASAAWTITLTSLATSSTFLAGRESTVYNTSSNLYLDLLIGGKIKTGGSAPTVNTSIRVYVHGSVNDTPTYVDAVTGSDANLTVTDADTLINAFGLLHDLNTPATANSTRWFRPLGAAKIFDGFFPSRTGLYVVHNIGQNLSSTASDHVINYTPVYITSA